MKNHFKRSRSSILSIATLLILSACSGENAPKTAPTLALKECRVPGIDNAIKCATYDVFENRETKSGRKIGLNIVVLPASAKAKEPDPIFLFAGGPGQAATDLAVIAQAVLGSLNNKRDIVLIDQRGTGKSNLLNCKFPTEDNPDMANPIKRRELTIALYTECRDTLAKKADLTQYGTTTAMADYDEVRQALGYNQINLWGASYGSRSAQEYLRRYPDRVRTMTIDSVASPSLILPENFARDAGAAIESAFVACEKSAVCNKSYPTMRADFAAMLDRLDKTPQKASVPNPLTGIAQDITVTRDTIAMAAFSSLYVPQLVAVLPESLKQANRGNYAPLMALTGGVADMAEDKIAIGMRMSVNCAEDVPRITPAMREAADKVEPFRASFIREFSTACEVWPKGKVADDFYTPVKSDKPVLLFSGALDPVTPPSFAEETKKTFSNSLHFVAPNAGHGTSHLGCGPKIIKQFIEKASVADLNGDCLKRLPRPMFYQAMVEKDKNNKANEKTKTAGEQK
jgi:pimeloyl-ACP methyl ester carboxylesterase